MVKPLRGVSALYVRFKWSSLPWLVCLAAQTCCSPSNSEGGRGGRSASPRIYHRLEARFPVDIEPGYGYLPGPADAARAPSIAVHHEPSAPGTQMLRNLATSEQLHLLDCLNIWQSGQVPESWRTAYVAPILKAG
ncbi:uncharacterized protein [Dermacentor albipictus]|uniref:uncharacterized protein isoform X2 n=1 Tax=Dermacentor albipictus TaxID=60249 RepID=UPI0038FCEF5C